MTLTQILDQKDVSAEEKLSAISNVVTSVREAYGNTDATITAPYVPTTSGSVDMKYLSADDKLVIAQKAVLAITMEAIAETECTEGTVFDREVERLITINPILTNLSATTGSKYI